MLPKCQKTVNICSNEWKPLHIIAIYRRLMEALNGDALCYDANII